MDLLYCTSCNYGFDDPSLFVSKRGLTLNTCKYCREKNTLSKRRQRQKRGHVHKWVPDTPLLPKDLNTQPSPITHLIKSETPKETSEEIKQLKHMLETRDREAEELENEIKTLNQAIQIKDLKLDNLDEQIEQLKQELKEAEDECLQLKLYGYPSFTTHLHNTSPEFPRPRDSGQRLPERPRTSQNNTASELLGLRSQRKTAPHQTYRII